MPSVHDEFLQRVARIAPLGVGLSVDVYSPNLFSLLASLYRRQAVPAYCEVFRAVPSALAAVRRHTECALTYHGEGLWVTQPGGAQQEPFLREARAVAAQLSVLQSAWSNHECASKYVEGYSFGTYLPPLYTPWSAAVVAANIRVVQEVFDRECRLSDGGSPLFLLEMAPLTYFVAGTISIPSFFRRITESAACGLVLDIGHLWTVYRYSGAWRTQPLPQFVDRFLAEFPVERVVEIHVAGLAVHEAMLESSKAAPLAAPDPLPLWTDAHMAPIPPVLFDVLDQVLAHPRLVHLKGVALEVDTKPIDMIGDEFDMFRRRYAAAVPCRSRSAAVPHGEAGECVEPNESVDLEAAHQAYERYARVLTGGAVAEGPEWTAATASADGLGWYRETYWPYEILVWGGDIQAMFPDTCRGLAARGVGLEAFVPFWSRAPQPTSGTYDFFETKIDRWLEFVGTMAPDLSAVAQREAQELREAYRVANEAPLEEPVSESR